VEVKQFFIRQGWWELSIIDCYYRYQPWHRVDPNNNRLTKALRYWNETCFVLECFGAETVW